MNWESLQEFDVLLSGQVLTSRTETIEDYLRSRVRRLGVIGIAGAFSLADVARCTEYRSGRPIHERRIPSVHVRQRDSLLGRALLIAAYVNYLAGILGSAFRMKGRFDLFIGVSGFSAFVGVVLKRLRKARHVVYYSIDYPPVPSKFGFDRLLVWALHGLDRFCARNADVVWHITRRIAEGRARMGRLSPDAYTHFEVPLSYRESLLRSEPPERVERWTVGFVGTITETQGLQLLAQAIPELAARFPELKVRIVGQGPYAGELKELVAESGCAGRFIFHGLVEDEEEMLNIIARCAIAVAPWTQSADNNILYADPGKPKLYMCLGVPCVITRGPDIAEMIHKGGAGMAVDHDRAQLVEAVAAILKDDATLWNYRRRAADLGGEFTSEKILKEAMEKTMEILEGGVGE